MLFQIQKHLHKANLRIYLTEEELDDDSFFCAFIKAPTEKWTIVIVHDCLTRSRGQGTSDSQVR